MNFTVIIPFYNGHDFIHAALASIAPEIPVIVVDDMSERTVLTDRPNTRVLRLTEKGYFSGAVNAGIAACSTDVLVINQDVAFKGNQWQNLLAEKCNDYAMIGQRINGKHPAWENGYIHGTFMYIRRDAWKKVGPLNEVDFPLWGSTAEWQVRACRAGYKVLPVENVPGFVHLRKPGQNFGSSIKTLLRDQPEKYSLFIRTPPLVSVVVACYNYGRYLTDAVNSLIGGETSLGQMGQRFQAFDVVIVDDFSSDETQEVGRGLQDHWKGVKYVRTARRMGSSGAYNVGVKSTVAPAVTILAADDMFEPWRLEVMYHAWEQSPTKMFYDDIQRFANGERQGVQRMEEYDFNRLVWKNQIHSGILLGREAVNKVNGWPVEMIYGREDWAMNIRLGLAGYCGQRVPRPGYLYRREGQGRSERNTTPQWRSRFLMQVQSLFPEAYKEELYPMACCGRGKARQSSVSGVQKSKAANLPGGAGMTLLQYNGTSFGAQTFFGWSTGAPYYFGKSRNRGYVDNRDLHNEDRRNPGLLDMSENGVKLFVVIQAAQAVPEPAKVDVPQAEAVAVNGGLIDAAPVDDVEKLVSVLNKTATEVVAWLRENDLPADALQELRDYEQANKGRKTVLSALDGLLNA